MFPSKSELISLETHYELLSKRCLAFSGLPTPESSILDLDTECGDETHKLTLVISWISSFQLPRVYKTRQGMGGSGTFIGKTEAERERLIFNLVTGIPKCTLEGVNDSNEYLLPSSLISQELIIDYSDCFGTTFFVHKSGASEFLGACGQEISEPTGWVGARISYLEQDRLKRRPSPVVAQIGAFPHTKGYYGRVGADIIIDDSKTSSQRKWVIDLNVRPTGSTILLLLKGHFSDRRNLHEACTTPRLQLQLERDSFRNFFSS